MGDGMHKRGLEGSNPPPSPHGRNFSWLLDRSTLARKSNSNPPPPPASPSGGGGSRGGPPAAS